MKENLPEKQKSNEKEQRASENPSTDVNEQFRMGQRAAWLSVIHFIQMGADASKVTAFCKNRIEKYT